MAKKKTPAKALASLRETLLATINNSGETHRAISAGSGVDQPTISRFVSGERPDPSLSIVEKLCAYFGMEFTKPNRKPVGPPLAPKRGRPPRPKGEDSD